MSQNNQNRFAAMASDGNNQQRKNSGKKNRKSSGDDQTTHLLEDRKSHNSLQVYFASIKFTTHLHLLLWFRSGKCSCYGQAS